MISRYRKLLAPAFSLSLLACAFRFGPHGVTWFWAEQPGIPVLLGVGAAVLWVLLLCEGFRADRHGK